MSRPHILEIGDHFVFKVTHPDATHLLWTGARPPRGLPPDMFRNCTATAFAAAIRQAHAGAYDLVVAYPPHRSALDARNWLRLLQAGPGAFATAWLGLLPPKLPLAVLDMGDDRTVGAHAFRLMDRATLWFKRELPVDRFGVLQGTAHPRLPTARLRNSPRWIGRLAKLRPIGLPDFAAPPDPGARVKRADLFFVGAVEGNSTERPRGLAEVRRLHERGIAVDLPERLPRAEFLARMAQAWLTWSPEGLGWMCYRHLEAAACRSVPLTNYPTITRHAPLEQGIHGVFYSPEDGGLTRAVECALRDRDALTRMADAARAHVMAHHTPAAIVAYVIEMTLSAASARDRPSCAPQTSTLQRLRGVPRFAGRVVPAEYAIDAAETAQARDETTPGTFDRSASRR